jgi:hypothetical protein
MKKKLCVAEPVSRRSLHIGSMSFADADIT